MTTCAICLEQVTNNSTLPCGHYFHLRCLERCEKQECPVCRAKHEIPLVVTSHPPRTSEEITEDILFAARLQVEEVIQHTQQLFSDMRLGEAVRAALESVPELGNFLSTNIRGMT